MRKNKLISKRDTSISIFYSKYSEFKARPSISLHVIYCCKKIKAKYCKNGQDKTTALSIQIERGGATKNSKTYYTEMSKTSNRLTQQNFIPLHLSIFCVNIQLFKSNFSHYKLEGALSKEQGEKS